MCTQERTRAAAGERPLLLVVPRVAASWVPPGRALTPCGIKGLVGPWGAGGV